MRTKRTTVLQLKIWSLMSDDDDDDDDDDTYRYVRPFLKRCRRCRSVESVALKKTLFFRYNLCYTFPQISFLERCRQKTV